MFDIFTDLRIIGKISESDSVVTDRKREIEVEKKPRVSDTHPRIVTVLAI